MQYAFKFKDDYLSHEAIAWEHSDTDKGQIYTRPEVVEYMLTAVGLNNVESLNNARILEPSCGNGEFVIAILKRLVTLPKSKPSIIQLLGKVLAIDLVNASLNEAKSNVRTYLTNHNYSKEEINILLENWFLATDFLLEDIDSNFTHVVGNPPYVRVENIPKKLLAEYRRRYSTMTNRADLYIPFFEKSLSLLTKSGKLSFICTDRWTKNIYGQALRQLISDKYSLEVFINLYGNDVFEKEVMTYPAITQIAKEITHQTAIINKTTFTTQEGSNIVNALQGKTSSIHFRKGIVDGAKPWLLSNTDKISLIRKLESNFPSLEETGNKVFIGAATGANTIFIVDKQDIDIEESRLLPVITASEIKSGNIKWKGKYLLNTYDNNGVIDLNNYPKLANYLETHKEALNKRHVALKNPEKWFKTIDRVYKERAKQEKLLIPDISNRPLVIYDSGAYHPNNSIYYICSNEWNLHALKVVLLSDITRLFISIYSTKIAKGYLRFQAQHLRKLRIPAWNSVNSQLKERMIHAGKSNNTETFTALACEMYNLNNKEIESLKE